VLWRPVFLQTLIDFNIWRSSRKRFLMSASKMAANSL
jgi:hypothetical protein